MPKIAIKNHWMPTGQRKNCPSRAAIPGLPSHNPVTNRAAIVGPKAINSNSGNGTWYWVTPYDPRASSIRKGQVIANATMKNSKSG